MNTNQTLEPKTLRDKLTHIEQQIDLINDHISQLISKLANEKPEVVTNLKTIHSNSTLLLADIYRHNGVVAQSELKDMAKTHKVGRVGPLFRGRTASLTMIRQSTGTSVGLTDYGYRKLKSANLTAKDKH